MIRPETQIVTEENGYRPAGDHGECFYCRARMGQQHAADCVLRRRTVVVRQSFDTVVLVPESWAVEDIEFHRGESSWCANNAIHELQKRRPDWCWCSGYTSEFLREATEEDEAAFFLTEEPHDGD